MFYICLFVCTQGCPVDRRWGWGHFALAGPEVALGPQEGAPKGEGPSSN